MRKIGDSTMFPKAYENLDFLHSSDARVIRILAEYLEPLRRLRRCKIRDTIVFFGSARAPELADLQLQEKEDSESVPQSFPEEDKADEKPRALLYQYRLAQYYEEARELAKRLTEWSQNLANGQRFVICSGGGPGIMEAANRGAQEAGGQSIGFNISLPMEQYPNPFISSKLFFEFHYFFMRKFWFIYLAKALIVFPGGFGTLDEFFEVLTLIQTQKLQKQVPIVLYGNEYWHEVLNFDNMIKWGTISRDDVALFKFADSVEEAFVYLKTELEKRFVNKRRFWYL